jgi:hypothetical protein
MIAEYPEMIVADRPKVPSLAGEWVIPTQEYEKTSSATGKKPVRNLYHGDSTRAYIPRVPISGSPETDDLALTLTNYSSQMLSSGGTPDSGLVMAVSHRLSSRDGQPDLSFLDLTVDASSITAPRRPKPSALTDFSWLQGAIEQDRHGRYDLALQVIYRRLGASLRAGKDSIFKQCDQLLQSADVDKLSTDILLAFLSVTLRYQANLPSRAKFYSRVSAKFRRQGLTDKSFLSGLG